MKRNRRRWVRGLFIAAALFGLAACDDIQAPFNDPFVHPGEKPPAETAPAPPKPLTKEDLEEIYNFVVTTRETCLDMGRKAMALEQTDPPQFGAARHEFMDQSRPWTIMLNTRQEKLQTLPLNLPPNHPGPVLNDALSLLNSVILNFTRSAYGHEPYDPKIDRDLEKTLQRARALLDVYPAPPPPAGPIPLHR